MSPDLLNTLGGPGVIAALIGVLVWLVKRSEARVEKVTDQFVSELSANRDASVKRALEEAELHRGYIGNLQELNSTVQKIGESQDRNMAAARTGELCKYRPAKPARRTVK